MHDEGERREQSMKKLGILILLLTIVFATSCINGTTITGNPPPVTIPTDIDGMNGENGGGGGVEVGARDLAALAAAEIAEHPLWKGDYFAEFDDGVVNIYDTDSYEHFSSPYSIRPDGSVIADDLNDDWALLAFMKEDSDALDVRIVSDGGSVIDVLAATDSASDRADLAALKQCIATGCAEDLKQALTKHDQEYMNNAPGGSIFTSDSASKWSSKYKKN